MPFLLILIAILVVATHSWGQEHRHPAEHAALHDEFYKDWMRPDNPKMSCCSEQDCAPVEHVDRRNGVWWMQRTYDGEWLEVPFYKIEMNRDSPDGRSHMCSSGPLVFCAVIGTGG